MAGCAVKPGEKQRKYRFLEVKCLLSTGQQTHCKSIMKTAERRIRFREDYKAVFWER